MIAFGHTGVGAIVGLSAYQLFGSGDITTGLVLAGAASIVSHYITDFIPHGHFFATGYKKKILGVIVFDLALSTALFSLLAYWKFGLSLQLFYILFGIGGSQLPDILDGFIHIKVLQPSGIIKYEYRFHQWLHWHGTGKNTLLLGKRDIWQVMVVIAALLAIILK